MSSSEPDTPSGGYRIGLPRSDMGLPSMLDRGLRPINIQAAHWLTRVLYVLGLLSLFLPLLRSSWVSLALGGGALTGPGSLVVLALALYRAALVLIDPRTLDAPAARGWVRRCRVAGIGLIASAPIALGLQFAMGPLGHALAPRGSGSGIEFFVVGIGVALLASLAPTGVMLFEFSRLRAFELAAREATP